MAVTSNAVGNWVLPGGQGTQSRQRRIASTRLVYLPMALLATVVTLATTGFEFGVSNNVYHLPYVLGYAALPQFAHDQFYQDLRYIVSYVWPIERRFATEANVRDLFLGSYVVALLAYYAALLWLVARFAGFRPIGLVLAALLLGLTYLDSGYSMLAGENLVGGYFTETQVATALVTASLVLALDRRLLMAIVLLGLAFDAQFELALWALAALLGITIELMRNGVPVSRSWAIGGAVALLLAAPTIVWLAHSIMAVGRFDGDYLDYLGQVGPNQWLLWTVPLQKWVLFVSNLLLGFAALAILGPVAKPARGAFIGFIGVFVVGCALPFITGNQWVLNLRLMASDGFLQILASTAAAAVVVRDIGQLRGIDKVGLSVVVAASLLLSRYLLPIAALAMLARAALASGELLGLERRIPEFDTGMLGRYAIALLVLLLVAGGCLRYTRPLYWIEAEPQRDPGFAALVDWARQHTGTGSTFLVNGETGGPFDKFQMWSKREVWLDDRRGASGMWDPRYYAFWKRRIDRLATMHSPGERLAFSCGAGVDYYADQTSPEFNLGAPDVSRFVAYQARGYFVIDVKSYCASRNGDATR
ncbi:MAG TPA: hypothetical protein VHT74_00175 [Acetobacteraceae bacterium]|nr:hypothetical protein [Acetobacteraceae bacterium]